MSKYIIYIDNRERAAISLDAFENAEVKQLDIGDFQIVDKETQEMLFVFERKTFPDLLSSIQDGRYREQKIRALANVGRGKYMYICEFDNDVMQQFWQKDDTCFKSIQSAIINTSIRDGVQVFMSCDVNDTCAIVNNVYTKLVQGKLSPDDVNRDVTKSYTSCLIQSKRGNNIKDPRTLAEIQLSQVPGISVKNAANILDAFNQKTMFGLLNEMKNNPESKKTLLSVDKIGKKKAEALFSFLGL